MPGRPAPNRRHRWIKIILVGVVVVLLSAVGAGAAYFYTLTDTVTESVTRAPDVMPAETPTAKGEAPRPSADPQAAGAVNFVLLGSDSQDSGDSGAGRSDSIMVVHLNAERDQAYITSFPRDMYVDIPGHGKNKINAAFAFGGTKLIIQTLEGLLGTRMDHVVLIDFDGFIKLTDSLGGVTVQNDVAFTSQGFHFPKGEITVSGDEALAFVRARKMLPNGDLDRAKNQRNVIKAIVSKGLSKDVIANPVALTKFVSGVAEHMTVDDALTGKEIRKLGLSLRLTPSDIYLLQAPITGFGTSPSGQSIDLVDKAQLKKLGTAMKKDAMADYLAEYGA